MSETPISSRVQISKVWYENDTRFTPTQSKIIRPRSIKNEGMDEDKAEVPLRAKQNSESLVSGSG